jgi:hypothetical protein
MWRRRAQIATAGRDIKAFIVARQQKLEALTAQIKAATTIAAVEAVTWTFP